MSALLPVVVYYVGFFERHWTKSSFHYAVMVKVKATIGLGSRPLYPVGGHPPAGLLGHFLAGLLACLGWPPFPLVCGVPDGGVALYYTSASCS
jgi:hypothetical protein